MSPLAHVIALPVRAYRLVLSPWVGMNFRYLPAHQAIRRTIRGGKLGEPSFEALEAHGAFKGTYLAVRRITRCHPWGGSGIDNVPGGRD